MSPHYEMPAWPSCPSCDGTGFYVEAGRDLRCQCWVYELILNGPPEPGINWRDAR